MMNTKTKTKSFALLTLSFLIPAFIACGGTNSTSTTPKTTQKITGEALPEAKEILARYLEVTGGKAAYEKIHSYTMQASMNMPAQGMKGTINTIGSKDGRFTTTVEVPGLAKEQMGFNGETGWGVSGMTGARIVTGAEKQQHLQEADILKDLHWEKYYKSANTKGLVALDNSMAYEVEMLNLEGKVETRFYDKESALLVKQVQTTITQMGEAKTTTSYRDYEKHEGIRFPMTIELEIMSTKQLISILNIKTNVQVSESDFSLPDDIKALLK